MTGSRGRRQREGGRSALIAVVSTIVLFSVVVWAVTSSSSWPLVQQDFFDGDVFWRSVPKIVGALATNIQLFLIAEVLVLVLGLLVAVLRTLPGPVFFPIRMLAIAYADIFRGLPGILVIFVGGFGFASLGLPGLPNDPFFWAVVSLTLIYTAYVSEVYRAGIESIHPSQEAAARSLGLTRAQALRHVVIPQAVRRVVPPLLNDFIGLQKDSVLVSYIGVVEAFRTANIQQAALFNFTPYLALAAVFLVITVPLTRLTDLLVARDRRQHLAGAR